jgi:hypothetical protein
MLKRFGIFGPPTIAFYGPDGAERSNYRVVGYMKAEEFARVARAAVGAAAVAAAGAGDAAAAAPRDVLARESQAGGTGG